MAIRLTRIYTRSGDRGLTALVGGARVTKERARLEDYQRQAAAATMTIEEAMSLRGKGDSR